ncbi:phosphotransferase [Nocardia carnea]|uniref:phosphotransferase n=1 Tax=Nocardia carnea TaxID=37328 RepID=UPI002458F955|nr:phosphotransferase [Nocardia carnea]
MSGAPTVDAVRRVLRTELNEQPAELGRLNAVLSLAGDLLHRAVLEDGRQCRRAAACEELLRALVPIMPWAELDPRRDPFGLVAENAHALVAADLVPDTVLRKIVQLLVAADTPEPPPSTQDGAGTSAATGTADELLGGCGVDMTVRQVRVMAERSGVTSLICRGSRSNRSDDTVVVRRYPPGADPYSLQREEAMLRYVHRLGGPAAAPVCSSPQDSLHARAMLVMRLDAETAWDAWPGHRLNAEEITGLATALARLHSIPLDAVPCTTVSWMRTPAEIEEAVLEAGRRVRAGDPSGGRSAQPVQALVFAWLRVNLPAQVSRPVLLHGRSAGTWLFGRPGGPGPIALDWQGARVGEAAQDLAAVRRMIPRIGWDEFLAAYRVAGGVIPPESRLRYYAVWHAACRYVDAYRGIARLRSPRADFGDAVRGLRDAPAELAECVRIAFGDQ